MECNDTEKMLPAYCEGDLAEAVVREIEEHLRVCQKCRDLWRGLPESWRLLETWGEYDPPERMTQQILSRISRQKRIFRWRVALPAAAALLIVAGAIFRFGGWDNRGPREVPVRVPMELSAERPDVDLDELIADLQILENEEFFDTLEEMVNIDYLPLLEEPNHGEEERQGSSLEMACS